MKNLKKVLALVVALTMVLGTVAFAFTDVADDNAAYTAVQTLSSLGILNGYEDGTFGPEKDITRAEFAAVVCRALGYDSKATAATSFSDVPADHWASGYINYVAGQGIVNGYGDGKFGPEDNVTYEQAVKMLVVALGYEPMAAQKGGYPTGYLVVANSYGMTDDVVSAGDAAPANRGIVAQLTYNALDIPMMAQTGFGTNVEYKVQDGNNGTTYTTLLTGLDVAKLEGVITATPVIGGEGLAVNEVEYTVNEANDNEYWEEKLGEQTLVLAEGVDASDFYGVASIVYVKEVRSGKWEVIAIMAGEDSAYVELDKGDIETLEKGSLKYYETETATKTTNLKLNEDAFVVIINNVKADIDDVMDDKKVSVDAEIVVYENTGDSKYDMMIVKDYKYDIVDEVEADKDRFTLKNTTGRFTFDFEDEDLSISIKNKDGEDITLADFAEGDVIAYILDGGSKSATEYSWIEIINLGQNAVSGTVTEVNDSTDTVYVDGAEYEVTADLTTPQVNEEGTFFLTKTNKIFGMEIDASVASNYAYILDIGESTNTFNNGWQVKLLAKDGSVAIYDFKDTFSVDGKSVKAETAGWSDLGFLSALEGKKDHKENVAARFVTYKLDANNKVRQINSIASADLIEIKEEKEFNGNAVAIDSKPLAENATIFNLVSADKDKAFVTTVSTLVHESEYKGFLVRNKDLEFDAFIITAGKGAIDLAQDIAVVDSVNTVTVNDDDAWKIRYYTSGDETLKEVTVTADTTLEYADGATIDTLFALAKDGGKDLTKGDVIMIADDGNGLATSVALVAKVGENKYKAEVTSDDDDIQFVTGYIKDITKTGNGTNITTGTDDILTIKGSANAYTYNYRTARNISITVGDWLAGDVDVYDEENDIAYYFFAVVENGVVSDIITHSVPTTK